MFKKTVVGGTFDRLHRGHIVLLKTAFENSESIVIGLTSDGFAQRFRTKTVRPFEDRKAALEDFSHKFGKPFEIIKIDDSYGVAPLAEDIDSLVVSEETLLRGQEINTIRYKKGKEKIILIVVPLVLGKDGRPLSSG